MPVRNLRVDLSVAGRFNIVRDGNVINGLTLGGIGSGVAVFLILGNNERIGPMANGPVTFGADTDPRDVSEGVWLETDTNYPGALVTGFVSYTSPRGGSVLPGITQQGY